MRLATLPLCLVLAVPTALAQGHRGPVHKPTVFTVDAKTQDVTNLVCKFADGSRIRLRGGRFVGDGVDTAGVNALLPQATTVTRLIDRSEPELDADHAALLRRLDPAWIAEFGPPTDLNLWYRFRTTDAKSGTALWQALATLPLVETVFPDTPPGYDADPTDIPPITPHYWAQQSYQAPAPTGIDTAVSRVIPGGRGEQLQILDVETALRLDHEDVPRAVAANVIGPNPMSTYHGLAVAGEMIADKNGYGVTGGVYRSRYKFHSHQSLNWASSVVTAAANSQPGDIIVLEVQLPCPNGASVCPMESRQDVFDAVRNATLAGIHVIAAAGNGSQNLDQAAFNNAFNRTVRDSGSILVGATPGSSLTRASFSNYGSAIDANGWGGSVVTTGYGDLFFPNSDMRQTYTATFSGTSSATPIVTSAAAAAISAAKQQLGQVLTVAQVRALLRTHGTDVPGGQIGKRPNLRALFTAPGLLRGLTLANEAGLGDTFQIQTAAAPGELWFLVAAFGPGNSALPFGTLLLDSASATVAGSGVGAGTHAFAVPNLIALRGAELHWQSLLYEPVAGRARLTNSVLTYIEN